MSRFDRDVSRRGEWRTFCPRCGGLSNVKEFAMTRSAESAPPKDLLTLGASILLRARFLATRPAGGICQFDCAGTAVV